MAPDKEEKVTDTVAHSLDGVLAKIVDLRDGLERWREGMWKGNKNLSKSVTAYHIDLAAAKLNYAIISISNVDISSISDIEISFIYIKSLSKSRVVKVVCNILEAIILLLEDEAMFAEANLMDYVIDELRSFEMPQAFNSGLGRKHD